MKQAYLVFERVPVAGIDDSGSDESKAAKGKKKAKSIGRHDADGLIYLQHHSNKIFKNEDGSPKEFTGPIPIIEAIRDANRLGMDPNKIAAASAAAAAGDRDTALALLDSANVNFAGELIILQVITF